MKQITLTDYIKLNHRNRFTIRPMIGYTFDWFNFPVIDKITEAIPDELPLTDEECEDIAKSYHNFKVEDKGNDNYLLSYTFKTEDIYQEVEVYCTLKDKLKIIAEKITFYINNEPSSVEVHDPYGNMLYSEKFPK